MGYWSGRLLLSDVPAPSAQRWCQIAPPPIREPVGTFHASLNLEDRDMLRCTVRVLKDSSPAAFQEDRFARVRETLVCLESIEDSH